LQICIISNTRLESDIKYNGWCSPRTRAALKYFLYGEKTQLDIQRVEALASGFQSFRDLMAVAPGGPDVPRPKVNYMDPTTKEALKLLFAPEGSYIQELLLTEVTPLACLH
jgi:aarF domain-containing kinase